MTSGKGSTVSAPICNCNGKHMMHTKTEKNTYGVTWRTYVCRDCGRDALMSDIRTVNKKYRDVIRDMPPENRRLHEKWLRDEKKRLDEQDKKTKEKKHVKRN